MGRRRAGDHSVLARRAERVVAEADADVLVLELLAVKSRVALPIREPRITEAARGAEARAGALTFGKRAKFLGRRAAR
ncbi:MAG TPA: hypothetical protein VGK73_02705, partial [Polyangiaceae bacterium]